MKDAWEIHDYARFRPLIVPNARLELLASGLRWAEGPVYFADGDYVLVSDIPNNRILRWVEGQGVSVFRQPSDMANGNTRDRQGRLVTCEHLGRRVTRTEYDGTITVLADRFQGKRFNSPNDVVVKSDGSIWFTDPDYGLLSDFTGRKSHSEIGRNNVYRLDPESGLLTVAAGDLVKPNGLAFSPDESVLYIADSGASHDLTGPHHIVAYRVRESGEIAAPRVVAVIEPGIPDGFRVDVEGNIWTSARDGVHCYSAAGELLGKILVPETVANLCFGGPGKSRLFIAAHSSLYAIFVGVRGAGWP